MSTGTSSPVQRFASSEARVKVLTQRATSARAYWIGLPISSVMVAAISSLRRDTPSAIARRISARRPRDREPMALKARSAASVASSISGSPPRCTRATSCPS